MGIASKTTEVKYVQKGNKGAKIRMRSWAEGVKYLEGVGEEKFYDVVEYSGLLYLCIKSHTSAAGVNDPINSIAQEKGFWEDAQDWLFIATKLLLAEKIKADQIDADGIVAKDVNITGEIHATSGTFENVTVLGKIGGFKITETSLIYDYADKDSGEQPSVIINASGSDFFRINENPGANNPFLKIRADRRTAIWIDTGGAYKDAPTGIRVLCNAGGFGKAIESYGNVSLIARSKENITINGLALNVRTISSSIDVSSADDVLISTASSNITLKLPRSGHIGKVLYIRKAGDGNITVLGNGLSIKGNNEWGGGGWHDSIDIGYGQLWILFCTGGIWLASCFN